MSSRKIRLFTPAKYMSEIWVNFGFKVDDENPECPLDKTTAICRHCDKGLKFCNNTSNLKQHLVRCAPYSVHVRQKASEKASSTVKLQKPITDFCRPTTKLASKSKRATELTDSIIRHIVLDLKSLNTVEGIGFRQMMAVAVPEYVVPCRFTITKGITDLATASRAVLSSRLGAVKYVALTCDYWTSLAVKSFLGITCHYINEQWELVANNLSTYHVTDAHTAINVAGHVNDALAEWEIAEKTVAIVTDSASNMVGAMTGIETEHVRCAAHLLQLSIKKGFQVQAALDIVSKGRKIVGHFNQSPKASAQLAAKQVELHMPEKKLIQDVVTRWNSSRNMLNSLVENRTAINDVLEDDPKFLFNHLVISCAERDKMRELHSLLEPFGELTTLLGGEKYVSSSIVLPTFCHIAKHVLRPEISDSRFVKEMKQKICEDLQNRILVLKQSNVLLAASALDPRFKKLTFCDTEASKDAVWAFLKMELGLLAQSIADGNGANLNLERDIDDLGDPLAKRKRTLFDEMDSASSCASEDGPDIQDELLTYQTEKKIPMDQDPLAWWENNCKIYPHLSCLAKKFLAVPGTSVPSERLFSTGGNIVTKNRAKLSGDNVNNLMFLHNFLQKESNPLPTDGEMEILG